MAAPFNPERLEKAGGEVGLIADVMQSTNGLNSILDLGAAQVATSASSALAYLAGGEVPDLIRRLIWVDRTGRVEPVAAPPRPYYVPRVSPDGQRLAVQTLQSQRRIWVHDLRVPQSLTPVTGPELEAAHPVWTRDGDRIAFTGSPGGRWGLFWTRADGSQLPERLSHAEGLKTAPSPASWTRDGRLLFVKGDADVWLLSRQGNRWVEQALLASQAYEGDGQVSPDDQWLAYTSVESGRPEIYVRRFPSLADRRPVSSEGGREPVWARDGRELFYIRGSSFDKFELVAHDVSRDGAVATAGRALFRLAPIRPLTYLPVPGYDVTPDGKRFVFTQYPDAPAAAPPNQIHLILNWYEELRGKVPAGK